MKLYLIQYSFGTSNGGLTTRYVVSVNPELAIAKLKGALGCVPEVDLGIRQLQLSSTNVVI